MTATEALRLMLDELGVEWWPAKYYKDTNTCWRANGFEWRASQQKDGRLLIGCTSVEHLTPEQAIAATLGPGTCRIEVKDNMEETEGFGDYLLECDQCHWQMLLEPSTPRFKFCPGCGRRVKE